MEKNRGTVIAVIAALVVSVISLGVAFAAFSAQLTINGNATIKASTWNIHYSDTEDGTAPAQATTINNSFSGDYAVAANKNTGVLTENNFTWTAQFKTPGDAVQYEFYIVNSGDYNATYPAPTVNVTTCSLNPCPVSYTITTDGTTPFSSSNTINAGTSQKVVVTAQLSSEYGGDGTQLNGSDIVVTVPGVQFDFTQSGAAAR